MKFEINRSEFADAIARVNSCIAKGMGINNVMVEATDKDVRISGVGGESSFLGVYSAEIGEKGICLTNAKKLLEFIKAMPGQTIFFGNVIVEKGEEIRYPSSIVVKGARSNVRLIAHLSETSEIEWPIVPNIPDNVFKKIPVSILKELVESTHYAAEKENGSHSFVRQGILFNFQNDGKIIRVVASATTSISMTQRELAEPVGFEAKFVLPNKCVDELQKLIAAAHEDENALIAFHGNQFVVRYDNMTYFFRLIEGQDYPDISERLPNKTGKQSFLTTKDLLAESLKRAMLVFATLQSGVKFSTGKSEPEEGQPSDILEIDCSDANVGEVHEQVRGTFLGNPIFVGINASALIQIIANEPFSGPNGKNVVLEFGEDSMKPVMIFSEKDPNFKALIMPLRLIDTER